MIVRLLVGETSHAEEHTMPLSLIGLVFHPHRAKVNRKAIIGDIPFCSKCGSPGSQATESDQISRQTPKA